LLCFLFAAFFSPRDQSAMPQQMLPGLMIITGAMGVSGGLLYTIQWAFEGSAVGDHTEKSNRWPFSFALSSVRLPTEEAPRRRRVGLLAQKQGHTTKGGLIPVYP
jgi:hypothetical protein